MRELSRWRRRQLSSRDVDSGPFWIPQSPAGDFRKGSTAEQSQALETRNIDVIVVRFSQNSHDNDRSHDHSEQFHCPAKSGKSFTCAHSGVKWGAALRR